MIKFWALMRNLIPMFVYFRKYNPIPQQARGLKAKIVRYCYRYIEKRFQPLPKSPNYSPENQHILWDRREYRKQKQDEGWNFLSCFQKLRNKQKSSKLSLQMVRKLPKAITFQFSKIEENSKTNNNYKFIIRNFILLKKLIK